MIEEITFVAMAAPDSHAGQLRSATLKASLSGSRKRLGAARRFRSVKRRGQRSDRVFWASRFAFHAGSRHPHHAGALMAALNITLGKIAATGWPHAVFEPQG